MGKRLIAKTLNEQGEPVFTNKAQRWIQSYIHKILTNRAVLGEYQPRKNKVADGDMRTGFFPQVVDHEAFRKAQDALASRRTGKIGGRTGKISSLFTSLVFDATSGNEIPMHYEDKGKRSTPKLTTYTEDKDLRHSITYAEFESVFLQFLDELDWTSVLDVTESDDLRNAEKMIADHTGAIATSLFGQTGDGARTNTRLKNKENNTNSSGSAGPDNQRESRLLSVGSRLAIAPGGKLRTELRVPRFGGNYRGRGEGDGRGWLYFDQHGNYSGRFDPE